MARTWAEYVWPEWVPADIREQIQGFWRDEWNRGPDAYETCASANAAPVNGAFVEVWTDRPKECVACGRYVHAWNNIGRVVGTDGATHYVSLYTHSATTLRVSAFGGAIAGRSGIRAGTWDAFDAIRGERKRQIDVEHYGATGDDGLVHGELAAAAACYASPDDRKLVAGAPASWPWGSKWWKPTPLDRRRELVKAGALIVAEIARLDRAAARAAKGEGSRA